MGAEEAEDSRMFVRGLVVAPRRDRPRAARVGRADPLQPAPRRPSAAHRRLHPHPFGVILDTLIFHPAWWVGQHEPFHTLFGVQSQLEDDVEVRSVEPASSRVETEPEADIEDGHPAEPDQD